MPQLNVHDFPPQLIWLLITFVLLFVLMAKVALPKIGGVIDARAARIRADLDRAAALKTEAETAMAEYEKALAAARAQGQSMTRETDARLARAAADRQAAQELAARIEQDRAAEAAATARAEAERRAAEEAGARAAAEREAQQAATARAEAAALAEAHSREREVRERELREQAKLRIEADKRERELAEARAAADRKVAKEVAARVELDRAAEAAAAVAGVPTSFTYDIIHSTSTTENQMWTFNNSARRYSVSTAEGGNGIDFATAADPRLPICIGGSAACTASGTTQPRRDDNTSIPLYVQLKWPARDARVSIVNGIEARLIEAEAALAGGNYGAAGGTLEILNAPRAGAGVAGLAPLTDPGTPAARVDLLFRERAFWLYLTSHRLGDLRRLMSQYDRAEDAVFPTGNWHKGGLYGDDTSMPVPAVETNNPNFTGCLD